MKRSSVSWLVLMGAVTFTGCGADDPAGGAPSAELVEQHAAGLADGIAKGPGTTASYSFPLPEGWFAETDPLPPPWDPGFPFTGQEELRFLPGFGDGTSPQNFSYDYLLWIDDGPAITSQSLSAALRAYYQGLICGVPGFPCPTSDFSIHLTSVLKTRPLEIMTGSIDMLDMAHLPISLNLFVSSIVCPVSQHSAVLVSASPQPYDSPVYADLLQEQLRFRCH